MNRTEAAMAYWHDAVEEVFAHPEKTLEAVALERHLNAGSLGVHIRRHYRERWDKFCKEQLGMEHGVNITARDNYNKAAAYIQEHPDEILSLVACRFNIAASSTLCKYLSRHYPSLLPWRKEWNRTHKVTKITTSTEFDTVTLEAERLHAKEKALKAYERKQAWHLKELGAPVLSFAERIVRLEQRLNGIRDGLGDDIKPGDAPLLQMTSYGYNVTEWRRKQCTLDIIKRRMEQVKRMRGGA